VLVTALKELNKVRRAPLPGMLRAARFKPVVWTTADFPELDRKQIGLKGSPTIVSRTWVPEIRKINTTRVEGGSEQEIAQNIVETLWQTDLPERFGWKS
jgi:electron transfer flavoprotein beta subunit